MGVVESCPSRFLQTPYLLRLFSQSLGPHPLFVLLFSIIRRRYLPNACCCFYLSYSLLLHSSRWGSLIFKSREKRFYESVTYAGARWVVAYPRHRVTPAIPSMRQESQKRIAHTPHLEFCALPPMRSSQTVPLARLPRIPHDVAGPVLLAAVGGGRVTFL